VLVVHTSIPVDPERRETVMDLVSTLVEESREEDGVVRYRAMQDLTEPNVIRFFEQYEDAAAAEEHTTSPAYREFVEALPELTTGDVETIQFETAGGGVTEFDPADAVE
jgi:quinol monooxygenase YgiN